MKVIANKWGNQFLDKFPPPWNLGIGYIRNYPLICRNLSCQISPGVKNVHKTLFAPIALFFGSYY